MNDKIIARELVRVAKELVGIGLEAIPPSVQEHGEFLSSVYEALRRKYGKAEHRFGEFLIPSLGPDEGSAIITVLQSRDGLNVEIHWHRRQGARPPIYDGNIVLKKRFRGDGRQVENWILRAIEKAKSQGMAAG